MKKGRHRRFEEARAMKRSQDVDFDALFDSLHSEQSDEDSKPEHAAWSDLDDDDAEDDDS